ncbi:MAG: crossover junction endodeoxyribonuclease RuvC [Planctomycetaceae bacterium]|nr:crossover junction endodeoxyribonuclease RuvC [Planctomycetaceae bacterium]
MSRKKPTQPVDRYLGVDPGLNRTGYALVERTVRGPLLREGGIVKSSRSDSLAQRVLEIGRGIREMIEEYQPQLMAVEQVFSYGRNPKTALLMAHARGAILLVAAEQKIPVLHYTPTHIKKLLTGNGRASKEQIQHAIKNEFGMEHILEPNDVADATAVALCLYHSVRHAI